MLTIGGANVLYELPDIIPPKVSVHSSWIIFNGDLYLTFATNSAILSSINVVGKLWRSMCKIRIFSTLTQLGRRKWIQFGMVLCFELHYLSMNGTNEKSLLQPGNCILWNRFMHLNRSIKFGIVCLIKILAIASSSFYGIKIVVIYFFIPVIELLILFFSKRNAHYR